MTMTDEERADGLDRMMAAEAADPKPNWYWLSFIDPEAPDGEKFLGVAIVYAEGPILAVRNSKRLGINPGGEVAILEMDKPPAPEYRERLLGDAEARKAGGHPDA